MGDTGVLEALRALLASDPDVVDRDELGELIRHASVVRGFVDACDVRHARRGRELAEAGESESPTAVLMDEGRRSGKEAKAAQDRDRVCGEFEGFEEALTAGDVSGDHLDVLARLTKNLPDEVAADLRSEASDLLSSATSDYVSQFERSTKERLCETHHHLVHEGGWSIEMTADRVTTWIRPDGTQWWRGPTNDRIRPKRAARPRARPPDRLLV